jgi:hypothetical protein
MSKQRGPFATGLPPGARKALPCSPGVPPPGFGYPLGGVSSPCPRKPFRLPTLMGFALRGFFPAPWLPLCFQREHRSCAFPPDSTAWRRRSNGLGSRNQRHPNALPIFSTGSRTHASLSFRTSRAFFRRTFGKALPSPCPSRPASPDLRRSRKPEPQGVLSDGPASPLFRGARTRLVFPTDCRLPLLRNESPPRPIFSAQKPPHPCGHRDLPLCGRPRPS